MKKKIMGMLATLGLVAVCVACGKAESTAPEQGQAVDLSTMDVEKYVTLGEYKNLDINIAEPSVSDSQVEYYMDQEFSSMVTAENGITDRAVEVGDTVNIDYVGKKDDVAFEGGTAQGYNLTIGSGQFIDGFEDGLVGVNVGDTVDLDLTFPEGYQNADLAGAAVVFTVTVNYIIPEMSDEILAAAGNSNYSNVEEFREYIYEDLYNYAQNNYNTQLENYIVNAIIANCQYAEELPSALTEKYKANILMNISNTAAYYGMDGETYASTVYGTDLETLVGNYALDSTKQGLAFQAIANAEGITLSDEELDAELQNYAAQAGYATVEEYLGDATKDEFKEYFMFQKIISFVKESVNIISE